MLTNAQIKASTSPASVSLISSVAGSGKTLTLIHKCSLILHNNAASHKICLLSFTKAAADSLVSRLRDQGSPTSVRAGTFHSVFTSILYSHGHLIDRDLKTFKFLNGSHHLKRFANQFLTNLVTENPKLSFSNLPSQQQLVSVYTRSKSGSTLEELLSGSSEFNKLQQFEPIFSDFIRFVQNSKLLNRECDYDDIIDFAFLLFSQNNFLINQLFDHILIDEAMDCRDAEFQLIDLFAHHTKVTLIGDVNQSIYAFRGSKPELFDQFPSRIPHCKVLQLNENFRSTEQILNLANKVLAFSNSQLASKLVSFSNLQGPLPQLVAFQSEHHECVGIVSKIKGWLEEGTSPKEVAVLFRINSLAELLEFYLALNNINYYKDGNFPHSDLVESFLFVLFCSQNQFNEDYCLSFFNFFGYPKSVVDEFCNFCVRNNEFNYHNLMNCPSIELEFNTKLQKLLKKLTKLNTAPELFETTKNFMVLFLNRKQITVPKILEKLSSLATLLTSKESLVELFSQVLNPSQRPSENSICLSSIHKSKGLEYEKVVLLGTANWIFQTEPDRYLTPELKTRYGQEEIRLLYVAITRAKNELYLTANIRTPRHLSSLLIPAIEEGMIKVIDLDLDDFNQNDCKNDRAMFGHSSLSTPHQQFMAAKIKEKMSEEAIEEDDSQYEEPKITPQVFNNDDSELFESIEKAKEERRKSNTKRRSNIFEKFKRMKRKRQ
ncbi:hypothetical protein P9112_012297 [Eukaryota sp. TZLM1-RC]